MFAILKQWIVNLYRDEEGASGIEYALIAAMVAVVISAFVTPIGASIRGIFTTISGSL